MSTYLSAAQFVLDMGDSNCYSGSGNGVTNLGSSGSANDFFRGLSGVDATRTPTFNGTPNSLNRTNNFSAGANGKILTPQSTTDIFATAHQANAEGTLIVGLLTPSTVANNIYLLATGKFEGGGGGPSVAIRTGTTFHWSFLVKGDAGSTVLSQTSTLILPPDTFAMLGLGFQAGASGVAGNNKSWMYTYTAGALTTAQGFENFTPIYTSPSVNPAQSNAYIWQDGATGTVRSDIGCELFFEVGFNTFLTQQQVMPLMRTLWRRQIQNLP